jgi:pimeloyl-ACP methyl ester carboxylesterase
VGGGTEGDGRLERNVAPRRAAPLDPPPPDLDARSKLLLQASIASDLALRTALASVLSAAVVRGTLSRGGREDRKRLAFYADLADAADARRVFRSPPSGVRIKQTRLDGDVGDGGWTELLRFKTPYRALNASFRSEYDRARNHTVAAHHWRHESGPRKTLCVIHGFGASPVWFNSLFFSLKSFFAEGWDVLLYTLPFHGRRGGRLVPDGIDMFGAGAARIHEAVIEAVFDFRILLDHLARCGAPRVGVTGLSLGGYISALLAAVDERLDFVIPNAPVAWMPALVSSWLPANLVVGTGRRLLGIPDELLARSFALHSPLSYPAVVPRRRLMIVRGLGDKLAPPEQAAMLWRHWGRPRMHSSAGSHLLHFGRSAYLAERRKLMATPSTSRRSRSARAGGSRGPA